MEDFPLSSNVRFAYRIKLLFSKSVFQHASAILTNASSGYWRLACQQGPCIFFDRIVGLRWTPFMSPCVLLQLKVAEVCGSSTTEMVIPPSYADCKAKRHARHAGRIWTLRVCIFSVSK